MAIKRLNKTELIDTVIYELKETRTWLIALGLNKVSAKEIVEECYTTNDRLGTALDLLEALKIIK